MDRVYLVSDNCFSDFVFLTERHRDVCWTEHLFHWAGVCRQFALRQRLHRLTHPIRHTHTHTHQYAG